VLALIVDDSRASRAFLRRMLADCGFEVIEAGHGIEALERLDEQDADVALVDWHMPEMDGVQLVKALRKDRRFSDLPVMMVTGECDPRQMARALMAGADEYAMKPLDRTGLVDKLRLLGFAELDTADVV
jgi:two-component system, chemotaxis family, chemotaxis protein CheY